MTQLTSRNNKKAIVQRSNQLSVEITANKNTMVLELFNTNEVCHCVTQQWSANSGQRPSAGLWGIATGPRNF